MAANDIIRYREDRLHLLTREARRAARLMHHGAAFDPSLYIALTIIYCIKHCIK